jgi:hypothetical protein
MKGRDCPATNTCPEFKRCITIQAPLSIQSTFKTALELSPEEAIDIMQKLQELTAYIDDLGNPPTYWINSKGDNGGTPEA